MAFDMHADGDRQMIGLHEEFIFHLANADEDAFPALMWLWDAYYDSPAISPQQASALMHELLELWARHGAEGNPALSRLCLRLLRFFSRAARANVTIRTCSD